MFCNLQCQHWTTCQPAFLTPTDPWRKKTARWKVWKKKSRKFLTESMHFKIFQNDGLVSPGRRLATNKHVETSEFGHWSAVPMNVCEMMKVFTVAQRVSSWYVCVWERHRSVARSRFIRIYQKGHPFKGSQSHAVTKRSINSLVVLGYCCCGKGKILGGIVGESITSSSAYNKTKNIQKIANRPAVWTSCSSCPKKPSLIFSFKKLTLHTTNSKSLPKNRPFNRPQKRIIFQPLLWTVNLREGTLLEFLLNLMGHTFRSIAEWDGFLRLPSKPTIPSQQIARFKGLLGPRTLIQGVGIEE